MTDLFVVKKLNDFDDFKKEIRDRLSKIEKVMEEQGLNRIFDPVVNNILEYKKDE